MQPALRPMPSAPTILAMFAPWATTEPIGELRRQLETRLTDRPEGRPRFSLRAGPAPSTTRGSANSAKPPRRVSNGDARGALLLVDLLSPPALLVALDVAMRGDAWACGIWLTPPANPHFSAVRLTPHARNAPAGITIAERHQHLGAARSNTRAIEAVLAAHTALLRSRRPAAWAAIDAVREHGSARAAADHLGCAHQTVSRHLRRNQVAVTRGTIWALQTLLATGPAKAPPTDQ
jgi:hypothetical protein